MLSISYKEVEQTNNEIHHNALKIKEVANNLITINNKIKSGNYWDGIAAKNFSEKFKDILLNFEDIVEEIENCVLYIAKCTEGYEAIDKNIISEICNNLNISEANIKSTSMFGR